jgi:VIT1/CCC1 family predicted Fe2+/Mn2+ transporter
MSRRFPFDQQHHAHGLALYHSGATLTDIVRKIDEIEARHEEPTLSHEQHEQIEAASKSVALGFADGILEDIRKLSGSRLSRPGLTA